ncbi:hypothetical protein BDV98DRAFT_557907 [Pterulicium gracile]|uniref:Chromo domain-containing protein n=1 Tax=Pterulicium gracile TaxID=1884261 RepID=A0A5C3QZL1_9AGAR|nr:hypothetical protein BDV98DRAFT_557907 [Pterula gracilis]
MSSSEEEEEEEYTVEAITAARIPKGKKKQWEYNVKWKGYEDPKDKTWEPAGSFEGGSEHFIDAFWDIAITGGRDFRDLRQFKAGEEIEYFPVGPPRGLKKKKKVKAASIEPEPSPFVKPASKPVSRSGRFKRSLEPEESAPCSPPRKKSKGKARDKAPASSPAHDEPSSSALSKPRRARHDTASPPTDIPSAPVDLFEEETPVEIGESASFVVNRRAPSPAGDVVATERVGPPKRKRVIPAHRQKAANPRVKMFEPDMAAMDGAISVKARLTREASQSTPLQKASSSKDVSDDTHPDPVDDYTDYPPATDLDGANSAQGDEESHEEGGSSRKPTLLEVASELTKAAEDLPDYDAGMSEPLDEAGKPMGHGIAAALNFSFGASAPSRNRTSSSTTAWGRPQLFSGPLGSRSDIRQQSVDASQQSSQSKPFSIRVDTRSSSDLSLALQDDSPHLLRAISHNQAGPVGKFYSSESSLALMSCLRADGRSARVSLIPSADATQKEVYARFLRHLQSNESFIVPVNENLFVFSLPQSSIQHLLKVPPNYLDDNSVIVVSQVSVQLAIRYADTVMAATTIAW